MNGPLPMLRLLLLLCCASAWQETAMPPKMGPWGKALKAAFDWNAAIV